MRQDIGTLPSEEDGRLADRLAGLQQIIPLSKVRQVLLESHRVNQRSCKLSHEVTLRLMLAMALFTDRPIRQVFKCLHFARCRETTPCRSALCHARQRLGVAPLRRLFHEVVRPLATKNTPGAFYRQWRLMGIDGVVLNLPDRKVLDKTFGRTGSDRGRSAFPQLRKVSLVELGTHVEVAFVAKPVHTGEQVSVPALLKRMPADGLLLMDRGFYSYNLMKQLISRGIPVLCRVKNNLVLESFEKLSDGSYLARIYPTSYHRKQDREGIVVRVIRYRLNDPQRTGHNEEHVLVTTLLKAEECPARELIVLYHERWEQELMNDEQKTHHDPRRATKPANLRSETPAGVMQELYAMSVGHFVIRAMMFEAAQEAQIDPDRLSFTGCFQVLTCRLPECRPAIHLTLESWYASVLREFRQELIGPRRNRNNPRVIKQKMSKWPMKQPQQPTPPPLKKTFAQTVVMAN